MRIAQVAPLFESVPPRLYGGTERVVSYLTEELVSLGHEVTLFAAGDSITSARLCAPCARSLRLDEDCVDRMAHHFLMLEDVFGRVEEFDILHFHIDYLHYPLSRRIGHPQLTTLHGRLDIPDLVPLYQVFSDMPVVSISHSQRRPLGGVNWMETIYHGLPPDLLRLHEAPGEYLAFLGRISPEKRVDRAVEIALRSGLPLKIAAKVDQVDRDYFETRIRHLLEHPMVEFIGEIGDGDKQEFLGNARALLFPIDWQEPFGLVMIESLACGTPVIAWRNGSVPEILEDGITGFIVESVEEGARAAMRSGNLDRRECRRIFEERFSARRMALEYLALYERILRSGHGNGRRMVAN